MAKETVLDKIRKMTGEAIEDLKWPVKTKIIKRAVESFSDAVEVKRLDAEQKIVDKRKALTTCKDEAEAKKILQEIVDARIQVKDAQEVAEEVQKEHDYLFGTDDKAEIQ